MSGRVGRGRAPGAAIGGCRGRSGRTNKVVFVDDKPYSYLALVDGQPANGHLAWASLNAAGFGLAKCSVR